MTIRENIKLKGPPQSGVTNTSPVHTAFHNCMPMNVWQYVHVM